MEFEFDENKSAANREKHGIDFHGAQALWDDPDLAEVPVITSDEPRFLVVGMINGKHWSGVITYRGGAVRIISVRRSRKEEVVSMKAKEFDRKFDEGKDVTAHLDLSRARRPEQDLKRVNVDFPVWMVHELDKEAKRLGVPRQAIIKVWVAERLAKAS